MKPHMTTIFCANDTELATELQRYLSGHGFDALIEESSVVVRESDLEQHIRAFLEETHRSGYSIRKLNSTSILLSREIPIEDFGFLRCEMCGYVVSSEEELMVHRRAHGIQLL